MGLPAPTPTPRGAALRGTLPGGARAGSWAGPVSPDYPVPAAPPPSPRCSPLPVRRWYSPRGRGPGARQFQLAGGSRTTAVAGERVRAAGSVASGRLASAPSGVRCPQGCSGPWAGGGCGPRCSWPPRRCWPRRSGCGWARRVSSSSTKRSRSWRGSTRVSGRGGGRADGRRAGRAGSEPGAPGGVVS